MMEHDAMTLKVGVLNARNRFADDGQMMLAHLMEHGLGDEELSNDHPNSDRPFDVLIVPEAWESGRTVDLKLNLGQPYHWFATPYEDADGRPDTHDLAMIVADRYFADMHRMRLVGRWALRATLVGGLEVVGAHLDDRKELMRKQQTEAFLGQTNPNRRPVFGADCNGMHRYSPEAIAVRVGAPVLELTMRGIKEGTPGTPQTRLERAKSLLVRTHGMAEGGPMRLFEQAGYSDAARLEGPTKGPFRLDHIMVPEGIYVRDSAVVDVDGLSDHRAVIAELVVPRSYLRAA